MEFQFSNWSEFMHMAGHGPYVWACYLITALALMYLVITPLRQRRQLFVELQRTARIASREQQLKSTTTDDLPSV